MTPENTKDVVPDGISIEEINGEAIACEVFKLTPGSVLIYDMHDGSLKEMGNE